MADYFIIPNLTNFYLKKKYANYFSANGIIGEELAHELLKKYN
jgi:hypothetical protein